MIDVKSHDVAGLSRRLLAVEAADGALKEATFEAMKALAPHTITVVRPFSDSSLGQELSRILQDHRHGMSLEVAMGLTNAVRSHTFQHVVIPALGQGRIVLLDRGPWSSMVHFGLLGGVGPERVAQDTLHATHGLWPGLTLVLAQPADRLNDLNAPAVEAGHGSVLGADPAAQAYERVAALGASSMQVIPVPATLKHTEDIQRFAASLAHRTSFFIQAALRDASDPLSTVATAGLDMGMGTYGGPASLKLTVPRPSSLRPPDQTDDLGGNAMDGEMASPQPRPEPPRAESTHSKKGIF